MKLLREYVRSDGRTIRRLPFQPSVYLDKNDWWIGYYRGDRCHYVCLIPCVVIRWKRRKRKR